MSELSPSRAVALRSLERARKGGAYVRDVVPAEAAAAGLEARDAALALRLALGATAASGALDTALDMHLDRPGDLAAPVRTALRVSAFELLYLDTPAAVAVSQGVELARLASRRAGALANAVLRGVSMSREAFLSAQDAPARKREAVSAARRAGLPTWLYRRILSSLDASATGALAACALEPAPVWVHVRPGAERDLLGEGPLGRAGAQEGPLPGCYAVSRPGVIAAGGVSAGSMAVSDLAAQVVAAAAVRSGTCLEVGAGRGTKSFVMACLREALAVPANGSLHVATDLSAHKCALNAERLRAAGFADISCVAADGRGLAGSSEPLPDGTTLGERCAQGFDTVLLDAPCSGTGTMRRHPEIPWRLSPEDVASAGALPALQLELLAGAARAVAPGGELLYATCSVLRAEDEEVVERFLASDEGAGFSLERFSDAWSLFRGRLADARAWAAARETEEGFLRTVPAAGACDGHFCARLVRRR